MLTVPDAICRAAPASHAAVRGAELDLVPLKSALVSVSDKTGLVPLCKQLSALGVKILSTGGTAKALSDEGIAVTEVSQHTRFPEILSGRVKTLHPLVHGGILAVRGNTQHDEETKAHGIEHIDLVVVNLYPFAHTVAKGASADACVENVDIGGPCLLRAAAKNFRGVAVLSSPDQYATFAAELESSRGCTSLALRRRLAARAFQETSLYDAAVAAWYACKVAQPL